MTTRTIAVLTTAGLALALGASAGCISHDRDAKPRAKATGPATGPSTLATTRATPAGPDGSDLDPQQRLDLAREMAGAVDFQALLNASAGEAASEASPPPTGREGNASTQAPGPNRAANRATDEALADTLAGPDGRPNGGPNDRPDDALAGDAGADAGDEQRIAELARELGQLLRERAVGGILEASSAGPLPDYLRLALLESIDGSAVPDRARLESEMERALVGAEPAQVRAARDLARAWVEAADSGSISPVLEALERAEANLREASPLLRTQVVLCESVEGFGKIQPITQQAFLAGQVNLVIVYTELEGFGYRAVGTQDDVVARARGDRHAVEVSQKLTLFHEPSGDLQAWHQPWRKIVDTSRNRQRDFYLVNKIELPARLSVGRYILKVTTRDDVSGAEDEQVVPIRIVADRRLLQGEAD